MVVVVGVDLGAVAVAVSQQSNVAILVVAAVVAVVAASLKHLHYVVVCCELFRF